MIQIQLDNDKNSYLDTNESISISLEFNNPMFGTVNDLFKSYSYPFTLPKTAKNSRLLNYPNYINSDNEIGTKKVRVYKNGVLVIIGDLIVNSATESSISVNVQVAQKLDWFNVRKMTELTELGYVWQSISPFWYCELLLQPLGGLEGMVDKTISINVSGKQYSTPVVPDLPLVDIPQTLINLANLINADTLNNNAFAFHDFRARSNFIVERVDITKDFYVIPTATSGDPTRYVFEYAVDDTNTTSYDALTKAWIDNVMANPTGYIYKYAELLMLPQNDDLFYMPMNRHTAGEYDIIDDISVTSPQINLRKGLELILTTFGYRLESDFLDEDSMLLAYFANNHSNVPSINFLNDRPDDENKYFGFPEYFFFYKDKFPDVTLLSWLDSFSKLFCLYVNIDNKRNVVTIRSMNDVLGDTETKTYKTAPTYSIDKKENTKKGYKFTMAKPPYISVYREQYERHNQISYADLTIAQGANNIKTEINFLDTLWVNDEPVQTLQPCFFTGWWSSLPNYDKIPFLKTPNITRQWGERGNSPKANSIMFYLGFINGKPSSTNSTNDETLLWGVESATNTFGLYNKRWRKFIAFMNRTESVKRKIYISITDLASLDMSKKVRIDNQNYFIKKMRVQLTHNTGHELVAECDLLVV